MLDSGATRSAVIPSVASDLGIPLDRSPPVMLRGVTGSAVAQTIQVDSLSVGDLLIAPSTLPIVADAFGGAQGLLGMDGMHDKRIYIDFRNDFINVSYSRNLRAAYGFEAVPFLKTNLQLLMVNARVGSIAGQRDHRYRGPGQCRQRGPARGPGQPLHAQGAFR